MKVKERPIIFSAPMIRVIIAGTKTQTRRVVKVDLTKAMVDGHDGRGTMLWSGTCEPTGTRKMLCPYGAPGDRLWVKETWAAFTGGRVADGEEWDEYPGKIADMRNATGPYVQNDGLVFAATDTDTLPSRWRSPIYMPRWASRITLEITGVRVEQVQAISDADAWAEGVRGPVCNRVGPNFGKHDYRAAFERLWGKINGPKSWAANPWVWAVSFRMVST